MRAARAKLHESTGGEAPRHEGRRARGLRMRCAALLLGAALPLQAQTDASLREADWRPELGDTPVHQKGRERTAAQVHERLRPSQQRALAEWIAFAGRHELHVVAPAKADALVFGAAELDVLEESADTLDDTWELFEELQPVADDEADADPYARDDEEPRATLFFLFDAEGHAGPAWGALLDELAVRGQLVPQAVSSLRADPNSLTQRQERFVIQSTYDMAGDASQGDDEFRLHNELAHKFTWMLLLERFGRAPATVEWGLGYVAEQRLFGSAFLFDYAGFVAVGDHHDWPRKARDSLRDARKEGDVDLAALLLDGSSAGRASRAQMQAWALLDLLLHKHPERLAILLTGLAELHGEADTYGIQPRWVGDAEAAAALLGPTLDMAGIDVRAVENHAKRLK